MLAPLWTDSMDEIQSLIEDSEATIKLYNRHIPTASDAWLAQLRFHRDWEVRIANGYREVLAKARAQASRASRP